MPKNLTTWRDIPIKLLHELFELTPCGKLLRKTTWMGHKKGDEAGYINSKGYRVVCVRLSDYRYRRVQTHNVVFAMTQCRWPRRGMVVDHINRKRTDNRPCNLREASLSVNAKNHSHKTGESGYTGVVFSAYHGKFKARLIHKDKTIHLGYFDCPEFASLVREEAKRKLFSTHV